MLSDAPIVFPVSPKICIVSKRGCDWGCKKPHPGVNWVFFLVHGLAHESKCRTCGVGSVAAKNKRAMYPLLENRSGLAVVISFMQPWRVPGQPTPHAQWLKQTLRRSQQELDPHTRPLEPAQRRSRRRQEHFCCPRGLRCAGHGRRRSPVFDRDLRHILDDWCGRFVVVMHHLHGIFHNLWDGTIDDLHHEAFRKALLEKNVDHLSILFLKQRQRKLKELLDAREHGCHKLDHRCRYFVWHDQEHGVRQRVQMPRPPVLRGKQDWERDIRPLGMARRTCSPSAYQCGRTSTAERHGASSPARTFRLRGVRVATIVEVSSRGVSQQNHHGRVHHHTWLPLKAQQKVANTKKSNLV